MSESLLVILFRWLHIVPAAIAIGGVFFLRVIIPSATSTLDPTLREEVMLRSRRLFKFTIHTCILLLIISGTYNTLRLWHSYNASPGVLHGVFGLHLLLALIIFAISLWLLGGERPPKSHRTLAMVNLALLLLAVLASGTLKTLRERAVSAQSTGAG